MAGSAWSNQVVSVLIVQSGCNFQGLFMYSPTIGAGNLIASLAAAAGTDPYGNAYPAGFTTGLNTSTQLQLASVAGVGELNFLLNNANLTNGQLLSGITGNLATLEIAGPQNNTATFKDFTILEFHSSDGISTLADLSMFYVPSGGAAVNVGFFDANQWVFSRSNILLKATNQVTLGNTGNCAWLDGVQNFILPAGGGPFINGESFHTVSAASGTTGLLSGAIAMRVKKMPWNAIWMDMEFSWTATVATTFTFGSLPDATYYPNVARHFPFDVTGTPTAVGSDNPRIFVPTSGGIQVLVPASTGGGTGGASFMYPTN